MRNRLPSAGGSGPSLLVLHGPSLALLGTREPDIYGTTTLAEIDARLAQAAASAGARVTALQTNHEGALIDAVLGATANGYAGVLLNAAAYAHTSLALADAIRAVLPLPVVEVHLSNTTARGGARHAAPVGAACAARVEGFGPASYTVALAGLLTLVSAAGSVRPPGNMRTKALPASPKLRGRSVRN